MSIYKMCKKYLSTCKFLISIYAILSILSSFVSILLPFYTGTFIDELIKSESILFILTYCIILFLLSFFSLLINYIINRINVKIQLKTSFLFNTDVIRHIQSLPIFYTYDKDLTYLNQQINGDVNTLLLYCLEVFSTTISNIVLLPTLIILCFMLNAYIAFVLLGIIIFYSILYLLLRRKLYSINFSLRECQAKYFSNLFDQLQFIKFIKTSGITSSFLERLDQPYKELSEVTLHNQKFQYVFSGIDTFVSLLAQSIVYIMGAILIFSNEFTVGQLTIFLSYFSFCMSISRYFFNFGKSYQETMVSYTRIFEILKQAPECNGTKKINQIKKIHISKFVFQYPNSHTEIHIPELTLKMGNAYGITGPNGVGKTTILNTILGLYNKELPPNVLKINGFYYNDIDFEFLRRNSIATTEQEPILLPGSLLENIYLWSNYNKDTYVSNLFSDFNLDHLSSISTTDVSSSLSGGEKQKIALLRSFSKNASLIILDEPSSALDSQSKKQLVYYINATKKSKIYIIVSHDQEILSCCDYLIDCQGGSIAE